MQRTRRALSVACVLLGPALVSACSAPAPRATDPYHPSTGSNARTEQVDALGVAVVVDGNGNGRVVGTLVNTEDQRHVLTGASIKRDGAPVRTAVLADVVPLPPDVRVDLARAAPVSVPADRLSVGSFVELTLDITDGALVEMLVPVEAQKGPYADVEVIAGP